ncbi:protein-tyrosine phosphatase-like protein [Chytridium lagenaria]|nr:protein-tyrosine phosphatase-like protein [Chytridium lagenaria]
MASPISLVSGDDNERRYMTKIFPERFVYHFIEVSDSPMQNLIPYFPEGKAFISASLAAGGRVMVYCNNGLSRSPAFVVAYVMESQNMDFESAYSFVQQKRFCMNPHEGFKYQLKEYEPIFQAKAFISNLNYTAEQILHQGDRKRQMSETLKMRM